LIWLNMKRWCVVLVFYYLMIVHYQHEWIVRYELDKECEVDWHSFHTIHDHISSISQDALFQNLSNTPCRMGSILSIELFFLQEVFVVNLVVIRMHSFLFVDSESKMKKTKNETQINILHTYTHTKERNKAFVQVSITL
jgi:hypothetical protein